MEQTEEEQGSGIPPAVRLAVVVNSCDFTKTSAILPYASCNIKNISVICRQRNRSWAASGLVRLPILNTFTFFDSCWTLY